MARKNRSNMVSEDDLEEDIIDNKSNAPDSEEDITATRNALINGLRPLLVTKLEMWKGGREIRARHSKEASSYQPIIDQINELGKQIDLSPISLGSLRREG